MVAVAAESGCLDQDLTPLLSAWARVHPKAEEMWLQVGRCPAAERHHTLASCSPHCSRTKAQLLAVSRIACALHMMQEWTNMAWQDTTGPMEAVVHGQTSHDPRGMLMDVHVAVTILVTFPAVWYPEI